MACYARDIGCISNRRNPKQRRRKGGPALSTNTVDLRPSAAEPDRELVHSAIVRVTHWLLAVSFVCLVVSGIAILIIHPRLYWGETGTWHMPSLIDLPLPYIRGHSGWGRSLHFLSAWVCVLSGIAYVATGVINRHLRDRLVPARSELTWRAIHTIIRDHILWRRSTDADSWRYNVVQRLTYLLVVFVLFPAMVWTGLAMSPSITSQYAFFVTMLGGHQSARTLHFIVANLLVAFFAVHMAMLVLIGFRSHVLAMITGYMPHRGSNT
jgi:thiosulfate reductase cytochrome b subunit